MANRLKRIMSAEIPLWTAVVVLVAATAAASFLYVNFYSESVRNYVLAAPGAPSRDDALVYGAQPALSNASFFQTVKDSFVEQKADFIEADLSAMVLRVYKGGAVAKEVKIAAKGREGSWWETPAGLYKIEYKHENHFSSFGKVYQPWSMAFQGNFFIHGWPYYPGGEPVASSFSGGCIRLSNEDAKAVYDLVEMGMPVLVFEKDFAKDGFEYQAKGPAVTSTHYLAADLRNNFAFVEKGAGQVAPVGDITELVAALVSAEYINLDKEIGYRGGSVTAYNVLYPLLMESDDEAALALARVVGRERFVSLMNRKAKALGMESTLFTDAAGEDAGNVSKPEELFSLAKYIYNNRSFVLKISTGKLTSSAYGAPVFTNLKNENLIPDMPFEFLGGKFDGTEGAQSYFGVYKAVVRGEERPVAIIVLGSEDAKSDAREIARYVQANFR